MTSEIKNGLWSHLKSMTNMAYEAPDFQGMYLLIEIFWFDCLIIYISTV